MESPRPLFQKSRAGKKILIVNCYFDEARRPVRRARKLPQAMGPVFLAGAFARECCDIRLYNEQYSGPLEDRYLLGWPDMIVLTGLTTAFDRMLHLTAYARTMNRKIIVVAGGPAVRMLPLYSCRFFDYSCTGDIEQLKEVIQEAWGSMYVTSAMVPRYDLAYWTGDIGYLETSRYCNFRCSFCSLTAEGGRYQKYDISCLRGQFAALGRKKTVIFLDNNFYGNDRQFFLERLELIREKYCSGQIGGWGALVTNDFFRDSANLMLAKDAGCIALFSGIESFDTEWLQSVNKRQNAGLPQTDMIRSCLEAGISFHYGLMFDLTTRTSRELRRELEFILQRPDITLPSYLSVTIPMLGTPFFYECLEKGLLLPHLRIRDLDGTTIALRPAEPLEQAGRFVRSMQCMKGYRGSMVRHAKHFFRRYRKVLGKKQMLLSLGNTALLGAPGLMSGTLAFRGPGLQLHERTHIGTTERPDRLYCPAYRVDACYENHFRPTMLTNQFGHLAKEVRDDLLQKPGKRHPVMETAVY